MISSKLNHPITKIVSSPLVILTPLVLICGNRPGRLYAGFSNEDPFDK
jgi:hypothetical protein